MKGKTDGEEVLNDRVVQIAGDTLSVFEYSCSPEASLESYRRDRRSGDERQCADQRFVLLGEASVGRSEVQVAEHIVTNADRRTEKPLELWMVLGETGCPRMLLGFVEPDRVWLPRDCAQETLAFRRAANHLCYFLGNTLLHELDELSVLTDDAKSAEGRTGEFLGGGDDRLQHGGEFGLPCHCCGGADQVGEP